MSYTLYGVTSAHYGNPTHTHDLAGATLVFYRAGERSGGSAVRWGWKDVGEGGMRVAELGRTLVRDDGSFTCVMQEGYEGALLVALSVKQFRYTPETDRTAFGLLGVVQPEWVRELDIQSDKSARLTVALREKSFCEVLNSLDLWLVAGRVVDRGTGQIPLVGGAVTAFDHDVTKDDALGATITDSAGNFSLFIPSSRFKQAPNLPPPFEGVLAHELFGGPDLYFQVKQGKTVLLEESPTLGRGKDRESAGRCSFTPLFIDQPGWTPQTVTLWTHVDDWHVPDSGGLHDFDEDGFVRDGRQALRGLVDLNGQLSQTWLGQPVRFRFLVAAWTAPDVAPVHPTDYRPILAANLDLSAPYGALYTWMGPSPWDFSTPELLPAPDPDGWIAVDQSVSFVRDTGRLARLNTATLRGEGDDAPQKLSLLLEVSTERGAMVQPVAVTVHIC